MKILISALLAVLLPVTSFAADALKPRIAPSEYAGPGNSDCQPYTYQNGTTAILCPILDFPITAAASPHTVASNEWSGLIVASGGGTVNIVLPNKPPRGPHSIISFSTDGATGFTINAQVPVTMQGTAPVVGGVITAGPAPPVMHFGTAPSTTWPSIRGRLSRECTDFKRNS